MHILLQAQILLPQLRQVNIVVRVQIEEPEKVYITADRLNRAAHFADGHLALGG